MKITLEEISYNDYGIRFTVYINGWNAGQISVQPDEVDELQNILCNKT